MQTEDKNSKALAANCVVRVNITGHGSTRSPGKMHFVCRNYCLAWLSRLKMPQQIPPGPRLASPYVHSAVHTCRCEERTPPRHLFENFPSKCSSDTNLPAHPTLFFFFFLPTRQMSSVNIRIVPINRTHRGAAGNNEREKRHTVREKEEGRERARGRVTGERNRVQQLDGSRRGK